jgi:hypothetical protein
MFPVGKPSDLRKFTFRKKILAACFDEGDIIRDSDKKQSPQFRPFFWKTLSIKEITVHLYEDGPEMGAWPLFPCSYPRRPGGTG